MAMVDMEITKKNQNFSRLLEVCLDDQMHQCSYVPPLMLPMTMVHMEDIFHYSFTEVISLVCSVTKGHCVYREMYGAKIVHPVSENYHDFHMENIYHYSFY
jgi:predicted nucleic-acid-binding Zn-ribbon protein